MATFKVVAMTTKALSTEATRTAAREDCEAKIRGAYRRGLLATCEIAKMLAKIYREELYIDVTPDFNLYVVDHLHISRQTYQRILLVSQTVDQLQDAGVELPANQTHVEELARLEPPLRLKVWNELLTRFEYEQQSMTAEDIKEAVQAAAKAVEVRQAARQKKIEAEVDVDMDDEEEDKDNGVAPPAKRSRARDPETEVLFSEKGEAALAKIRTICGDNTADAIRRGNPIALSERELHLWAEQDDDMIRMLASMVGPSWSVAKALAYLSEPLDDNTSVYRLILIAHNLGGIAVVNFDNRAEITIRIK